MIIDKALRLFTAILPTWVISEHAPALLLGQRQLEIQKSCLYRSSSKALIPPTFCDGFSL